MFYEVVDEKPPLEIDAESLRFSAHVDNVAEAVAPGTLDDLRREIATEET
jgi:hypothetical protein